MKKKISNKNIFKNITSEKLLENEKYISFNSGHSILGDGFTILNKLYDNSIPLILTDIPYGVINRGSSGIRTFDKSAADKVDFNISDLTKEFSRVCNGSIYVFCSTEQVSELRDSFIKQGMTTRLCIWEKTNPTPVNGQYMWLSGVETCIFARKKGATFNEYCKNSVWRFSNGRSKRHPTEKPLPLFEYIMNVSSNIGDLVFDPFSGSGTTGEAAIKLERKFICVEKEQNYFDTQTTRLSIAESKLLKKRKG